MSDSLEASCGRCGYALRGLPAGSHCPECALPTDWSLGVRALHEWQRDDRAWTRRVRGGLLVLLAAQLILVIALVCSIANDIVRFTHYPFFLETLPLVVVLGALGAWMLGSPTLFAQCDRWWGWVRRSMRAMVFVTSLAAIGLWFNEFRGFVLWFYPLALVVICWAVAVVLTFAYLSASAEQIGSTQIASVSRHVMWALPAGMIVPPVVALFVWANLRPFSATPFVVVTAMLCGLWFVASYSTAVTVLVRLRRAIDDLILQRSLAGATA